ncbi:hypothetical protein Micbo1qcDRAFT_169818, partial [Microdochium bolleyi]
MAASTGPNVILQKHNMAAWILQILGCLAYLGLYAYILAVNSSRESTTVAPNLLAVIIIAIITLILVVCEMVLFGKQTLTPSTVLTSSILKTVMWAVYLIAIIIMATSQYGGPLGLIIDLPITVVLLAAVLSQLVISGRMVHRQRGPGAAAVDRKP